MNRKVVSLLSLLLILPLTSSPAFAAGASSDKEAGLAASFRSFLDSILEMGRWTIDPNGGTSETTDGRSTIDPDGMMAPADPALETDGRSTIDPNG
jgi:hypothetical protein